MTFTVLVKMVTMKTHEYKGTKTIMMQKKLTVTTTTTMKMTMMMTMMKNMMMMMMILMMTTTTTMIVKKKLMATTAMKKKLMKIVTTGMIVCLFVGCLTSQQHPSVSQGRICTDNFTCCHTEIEAADPTFHLTQSQYTDTGPTSPSTDPITPGAWQGSHWSANV